MSISIFVWDKLHNDLNFKGIKLIFIFFAILHCHEKVQNNTEFCRGNSKPHCDSQITTY